MNFNSSAQQQPQPPMESIPILEEHLRKLQSLVESISQVRYQTLPTLINNLQRPIQACNPKSNVADGLDAIQEYWKSDSQDLVNSVKNLRLQAINSQDAMKYVRATTHINAHLSPEDRQKALQETELINEKAKHEGLQKNKTRSSLSRRSKSTTGPIIEQHMIEAELSKRKKLKLQIKLRSVLFPVKLSTTTTIPVKNLEDCIHRINRFNGLSSDHLIFVSENQILLKDVMRVFLVFQPPSPHSQKHCQKNDIPNLIIERAFCFGLTESPTTHFQRSSFGLIRSINRCINHYINQYFQSDHDPTNKNSSTNLWLICSLLSSYKDFFRTEISSSSSLPSRSRVEATVGSTYQSRMTTVGSSSQLNQQQQQQSQKNGDVAGLNVYRSQKNHRDNNNHAFLTWRRWKIDHTTTSPEEDKLIPSDRINPEQTVRTTHTDEVVDQNHPDPDGLHEILSGGQWIKIPEIN
ncbi:hypothetical protein MJO28_008956 [Puccinia striiformis f. sp. tritici]|uniref:Uncharacterized protein n=2 Tax=Puccinia striiformis TaxID=27350 RepID=A0A2S4UP51_9BASI|nr:hypothetical protein MJO28_008956 [Puccinia striiformis f. sp. tritici]POV98991.1 hypothetical protein PSTT_14069 [Puccinia striiformis]